MVNKMTKPNESTTCKVQRKILTKLIEYLRACTTLQWTTSAKTSSPLTAGCRQLESSANVPTPIRVSLQQWRRRTFLEWLEGGRNCFKEWLEKARFFFVWSLFNDLMVLSVFFVRYIYIYVWGLVTVLRVPKSWILVFSMLLKFRIWDVSYVGGPQAPQCAAVLGTARPILGVSLLGLFWLDWICNVLLCEVERPEFWMFWWCYWVCFQRFWMWFILELFLLERGLLSGSQLATALWVKRKHVAFKQVLRMHALCWRS